jgi:hypothetical protein
MSERKVLNKYYPPDFDPAKLPRAEKPFKGGRTKVRLMLPFSVQCKTCGEYIGRGKKFNGYKEDTKDTYLTIKIWRFSFRCSGCLHELTFRTDPKNSGYECEQGAVRMFEPWRQDQLIERELEKEKSTATSVDPMKALEMRTTANRREMEDQDAIEELRDANARNAALDTDRLLETVQKRHAAAEQRALDEEARIDAAEAEQLATAVSQELEEDEDDVEGGPRIVRRLDENEDGDDEGGGHGVPVAAVGGPSGSSSAQPRARDTPGEQPARPSLFADIARQRRAQREREAQQAQPPPAASGAKRGASESVAEAPVSKAPRLSAAEQQGEGLVAYRNESSDEEER